MSILVCRIINLRDGALIMRKLRIYPDRVLKQKCEPVKKPEKYKKLVGEMVKIMEKYHGVGLAAPQVGELDQLFLMDEGWVAGKPASEQLKNIKAYFNPEIIEVKKKQETTEACLSFPGVSIEIERNTMVSFRALNIRGEKVEKTVSNLQAQCVQHETEHLKGVTLADNASLTEKIEMQKKLKEYRKRNEIG